MIPTDLQDELKKRLETAFEHDFFNAKGGIRSKLSVFTQNLPKKTKAEDEFFPFIIVKLMDGEQKDRNSTNKAYVGFVIGAYDNGPDNQGYREVTQITNKIIENLKKSPTVNGQFQLDFPLKWKVHDEETDPYFFGAVEAAFEMPEISSQEVEDLI